MTRKHGSRSERLDSIPDRPELFRCPPLLDAAELRRRNPGGDATSQAVTSFQEAPQTGAANRQFDASPLSMPRIYAIGGLCPRCLSAYPSEHDHIPRLVRHEIQRSRK